MNLADQRLDFKRRVPRQLVDKYLEYHNVQQNKCLKFAAMCRNLKFPYNFIIKT